MNRFIVSFAAMLFAGSLTAFVDGSGLNDAQIAHIAYTAGEIDVEAARLALQKSRNPDVRSFAETMFRDHQAVNEQALVLLHRLGVTPEAHATSASLMTQASEDHRRLAGLEGDAFDRAYVENEVEYHRTVNGALSGALIPSARNAELASLLQAGLALFGAHQAHAEQLEQQLAAR